MLAVICNNVTKRCSADGPNRRANSDLKLLCLSNETPHYQKGAAGTRTYSFPPLFLTGGGGFFLKKISINSALHGNDSYRETNRASRVASSMLNCYIYAPPTVQERLAYGSPTAGEKRIAQMEYLASALEKVIQGSGAKKSA